MAKQSTGFSKIEKKVGSANNGAEQLLYSRKQVAHLLGDVDVTYVKRLEKLGLLKSLRLTRAPTALALYRAADVLALIDAAANPEESDTE